MHSIIALIILGLSLLSHGSVRAANRIAIISIDSSAATTRTIKGVKNAVKRYSIEVDYRESVLSGNPVVDRDIFLSIQNFQPDLFITIGSYATDRVSEAFPYHPIVFADVLNPEASGFVSSMERPGRNITGAALDIPPHKQFHYFKRVVGNLEELGVIYSADTKNIIQQARIAAKELGLRLIAIEIESEKDIPYAIDSLCEVADALWSVADQKIYTPHSTRYIILQTLRYGLPMMSFSQGLLEAGGLFTLDFDFKDIGRQAGETAIQVLHGVEPSEIPVTTPGIIYFKYNEKTANRIKIEIPDELLAVAKEVIK
jgi:putative ABC transport system substrate-binding protein